MTLKLLTVPAVCISLAALPTTPAHADGADFAAGIVTGVIGSAIVRDVQKKNQRKTYRKSTVNSYQRQQNREVQTSLNYFGFPAGTPDGVLGRNSRSAISQYQIFMGYPATGYLADHERGFLLTSYQRAIAGGGATAQMVASNPQGTKGLLLNYRNQNSIVQGMAPVQAPVMATAPVQAPAVVPTPAPVEKVVTPVTTTVSAPAADSDGGGALPNFLGNAAVAQKPSLASHCNKVSLLSTSNGGLTQVSAVASANPKLVLSEQFCLARTYAIAQGEEMTASVQGVTPQQIESQCKGIAPAMKEHILGLSIKPGTDVVQGVSSFALSSGMEPAQLAATARICLGVGYRIDDMDVALASGLLLYALGEPVYGELMGHHLSQGFGTSIRMDLAQDWYQPALAAMEAGAAPLVQPTAVPERAALLRDATMRMQDGGNDQAQSPTVVPAGSTLPNFTISQ